MIPFASHTVDRLRGVVATDDGGGEYVDWETPDTLTISGVNVQPLSAGNSSEREAGDERTLLIDRWVLHAPPGSDIKYSDRIRYDGVVYEVDGFPKEWPSPFGSDAHHLEVRLRRDVG